MTQKKSNLFCIFSNAFQICLYLCGIVLAILVAVGVFSKYICYEISTCYAILIFLAGTIITLKFSVLNDKNKKIELFLFVLGLTINVLMMVIAYTIDCRSVQIDLEQNKKVIDYSIVKEAALLLNAVIWIDFVALVRNFYFTVVILIKKQINSKREKKEIIYDNRYNKVLIGLVISMLIVVLTLIIYCIILNNSIKTSNGGYNDGILAAVISGICAIIGGALTLIGVKMTLSFEKDKDKKNTKEANKPQLYAPLRYKLNEINFVSVNDDKHSSPIINRNIILKNSSKCTFKIIGIKVNTDTFNSNLNIFIEKKSLFGLCFNYSYPVNTILLKIESNDGLLYECSMNLDNNKIVNLEVKDASIQD